MNKSQTIIAAFAGSTFTLSFILFSSWAASFYLRLYPSKESDDVRVDLIIPVYGTAYLISCLTSYAVAKIAGRSTGRQVTEKEHLKFALLVPAFFVVFYLIISAIFMLFVAARFNNNAVDEIVLYTVSFSVIIADYFYVLEPKKKSS